MQLKPQFKIRRTKTPVKKRDIDPIHNLYERTHKQHWTQNLEVFYHNIISSLYWVTIFHPISIEGMN